MTGDVTTDGVHAFKTRDGALGYAVAECISPLAIGRVALWGTVIEHVDGWRAEHAKVVDIDFAGTNPWSADAALFRRLRERYGLA